MHGMWKLTLVKHKTRIQRIRVDPSLCGRHWLDIGHVPFVASVLDAHEAVGLIRLLDSKATLKFRVVLGNTPLFKWKDST